MCVRHACASDTSDYAPETARDKPAGNPDGKWQIRVSDLAIVQKKGRHTPLCQTQQPTRVFPPITLVLVKEVEERLNKAT